MAKRNEREQAAYENACDCIYYGYERGRWNSCGLSTEDADRIWKEAYYDMTMKF